LGAAALAIANGATGTDALTLQTNIAAALASTAGTGKASASKPNIPDIITITASNQLIDPGAGDHSIQFLTGANADTLVLHAGGLDQVSGFDPGSDVLDLRSLLNEANVRPDTATTGNYLTVADQDGAALVNFDPTGHGGGSTVAVLQGLGGSVTSLGSLIGLGAVRIM
jgi:hypothetical protein